MCHHNNKEVHIQPHNTCATTSYLPFITSETWNPWHCGIAFGTCTLLQMNTRAFQVLTSCIHCYFMNIHQLQTSCQIGSPFFSCLTQTPFSKLASTHWHQHPSPNQHPCYLGPHWPHFLPLHTHPSSNLLQHHVQQHFIDLAYRHKARKTHSNFWSRFCCWLPLFS